MGPESNHIHEHGYSPPIGVDKKEAAIDGTDDRNKTTRHPRWTRQETFILIQGKKVVENGVWSGRHRSTSTLGLEQLEPKWNSISSYCKQHGVNRGPVQCRKRWSNLLGDFKKIRKWESDIKEEAESFWMVRSDVRRERKLPGFFDREVYNVLDGRAFTDGAFPLALIRVPTNAKNCDGIEAVAEEEEEGDDEEEPEAVFDSGRQATAEDGLFSDFEQSGQEESDGSPEAEKETIKTQSPTKTVTTPIPISGTVKEKHPGSNKTWRESKCQEGWKRRRLSLNGHEDITSSEDQLIKVLERNGNKLNAHLEAQNINCQLDRDQQKEHTDSLVAALSKLTDALERMADKL